jgi:hypothetical protein
MGIVLTINRLCTGLSSLCTGNLGIIKSYCGGEKKPEKEAYITKFGGRLCIFLSQD